VSLRASKDFSLTILVDLSRCSISLQKCVNSWSAKAR
jgi:hypothetical protein